MGHCSCFLFAVQRNTYSIWLRGLLSRVSMGSHPQLEARLTEKVSKRHENIMIVQLLF